MFRQLYILHQVDNYQNNRSRFSIDRNNRRAGHSSEDFASPLARSAFSSASAPASQAKPFRLGHLTIAGNAHTKLFVILRMIPLAEGDIFNQSLWEFGLEQASAGRCERDNPNQA